MTKTSQITKRQRKHEARKLDAQMRARYPQIAKAKDEGRIAFYAAAATRQR